MGRLKKDHSGWKPSGLWLKYKPVAVPEPLGRLRAKKSTRRWCKGKQGVEHVLERRFRYYGWQSRRSKYIYTTCTTCGKEFNWKNNSSVPLKIEIDNYHGVASFVQVKVNGLAVPINYDRYYEDRCWCGEFHSSY